VSKVKGSINKKSWVPTEVKGLLLLFLTLLLILSLLSFKNHDPESNWLGLVGYGISFTLVFNFGLGAYLLVLGIGILGWKILRKSIPTPLWPKLTAFSILLLCSSTLCSLIGYQLPSISNWFATVLYGKDVTITTPFSFTTERFFLGGLPFDYLYQSLPYINFRSLFSNIGISIIFGAFWLLSFLYITEIRPSALPWYKLSDLRERFRRKEKPSKEKKSFFPNISLEKETPKKEVLASNHQPAQASPSPVPPPPCSQILTPEIPKKGGSFKGFSLPPCSLLTPPKKSNTNSLNELLKRQGNILEETLLSFNIEAKVTDIHCGPTIASFEIQPAVGVKVQKIKALEDDIALNLQAKSIRIIAPIPGKAVVGIEVPAPLAQEVGYKDLLSSYQKEKRHHHIPLLLGQTVSGEHVSCDLSKMPHCIIAGATGSGKSVCVNTMIISMLMNKRPDELKLLMIDPKKVELTPYSNLPHMLSPVITEPNDACLALKWLVSEMEVRYEIFKQLGVRNIHSFNQRKRDLKKEEELGIPIPEKFPFYVGIIDELADLMMVASQDIETPIARIAQMARAVGIHLIVATQRPSREVITGLIKANFPTRISCKVASRVNSQIILDETGAESLLGNGDMLILLPGNPGLLRAQGAFIRDQDINAVIQACCQQAPTNYLIPSFSRFSEEDSSLPKGSSSPSGDTLYKEARKLVIETGNASTTFLQRKLKVGYARAASLMDELEAQGVVSAQEGSKARKVLANEPKQKD
jgi:S-DNA-T family DNA segregation ATPase FtsK/SpoIIIE